MKKNLISLSILAICSLMAIPAAAQHPAGLLAVHGIDGRDLGFDQSLPVDVAIDGACALTDFQYGQTVGPVALPKGTYTIAISLSDGSCGGAVVIEADVKFGAGKFKSVPTRPRSTSLQSRVVPKAWSSRLRTVRPGPQTSPQGAGPAGSFRL
jgi:hypothetical protein